MAYEQQLFLMVLDPRKLHIKIQVDWQCGEGPFPNSKKMPFPCAYKEENASKVLRPLCKGTTHPSLESSMFKIVITSKRPWVLSPST